MLAHARSRSDTPCKVASLVFARDLFRMRVASHFTAARHVLELSTHGDA